MYSSHNLFLSWSLQYFLFPVLLKVKFPFMSIKPQQFLVKIVIFPVKLSVLSFITSSSPFILQYSVLSFENWVPLIIKFVPLFEILAVPYLSQINCTPKLWLPINLSFKERIYSIFNPMKLRFLAYWIRFINLFIFCYQELLFIFWL